MDARLESVGQLLTGPRLLEGHGSGRIRLPAVCRLLGVPIHHRLHLLAWVEQQNLWAAPPTDGPLQDAPLAGCIDLATLRAALQQALAGEGLPFENNLGEGVRHAA